LVGKGNLPDPYISKITRQCYQDETIPIEVAFNQVNTQMDKAKTYLVERNTKADKKGENLERSARAKLLKQKPTQYIIEYSSAFFNGDRILNMDDNENQDKRVMISFTPNSAGLFLGNMTIKSVDNPLDVRS